MSGKNILVVDDDPTLRQIIVMSLQSRGYSVAEAENGAKALAHLDAHPADLVLSDIRMPEMDGVEMLRRLRQGSQVKFILMTGFSDVLESQSAFDLGANEFIAKPFSLETLISIVRSCLDPAKPEAAKSETATAAASEAARHCRIHIDEFISTTKLISDVYIKLGSQKMVKVAHEGEEVPVDRLRFYKEKKVDYLFVAVEDYPRYVQLNIKIAKNTTKLDRLTAEKKAWLFNHTAQSIVQKCFIEGLDEQLFGTAQTMVEDTLKVLSEDPMALSALLALQSHSDTTYIHSVAVSLYACLIVKSQGWNNTGALFRITTAGLFHDIGKKEIDESILGKKRLEMTAKEVALYESHPLRGRDLLRQMEGIPEEVGQIVAHHHEDLIGTGYPQCLKSMEIHPLAKLLHVTDAFCHLVLDASRPMAPADACRQLNAEQAGRMDPNYLKWLGALFDVEPEKTKKPA